MKGWMLTGDVLDDLSEIFKKQIEAVAETINAYLRIYEENGGDAEAEKETIINMIRNSIH